MTGLLPLAHTGEPANMSRLNQAEILVVKRASADIALLARAIVRTHCQNSPSFAVALNCGMRSGSWKAEVNASERLPIVRDGNTVFCLEVEVTRNCHPWPCMYVSRRIRPPLGSAIFLQLTDMQIIHKSARHLDNAEAALKNLRKQRERKEREIGVRLGEVVSSLHEDPQAQKELGDLTKRFGIAEADTSLCVRSRPNTCEAN